MTLVIAHRGLHEKDPENTLSSFRNAIKSKVPMIEFDIRLTKDKIPVVIHDRKLNRTTNGKGFVQNKTFEELQKLKCKNETISSLEQIIESFKKKTGFLIELKDRQFLNEKNLKQVTNLIKENKLYERVIISSFFPSILKKVKKLDKKIKVCCNMLYPFKIDKSFEFIAIYYITLNKKTIEKAHTRGKKVFAFPIDPKRKIPKEKLKEFLSAGIDGIITNYPKEVQKLLKTKT